MTLYCLAAGIFFAAAAYAQFNDPDPALWIAGYLLGGCVFNFLPIMLHQSPILAKRIRPVVVLFATGNTLVLMLWIHSLIFKIDFDLPFRELAWSVLEYEEGREIGGLLLLLVHVLRIAGYLKETPMDKAEKSSGLIGTFVAAGMLVGAAHLWINYQQSMNQRDNVEHCNGQFGSGLQQEL